MRTGTHTVTIKKLVKYIGKYVLKSKILSQGANNYSFIVVLSLLKYTQLLPHEKDM